jgi:hypothetical protein
MFKTSILPVITQDDVNTVAAKSFLYFLCLNIYIFKGFLESCLVTIRLLRKIS